MTIFGSSNVKIVEESLNDLFQHLTIELLKLVNEQNKILTFAILIYLFPRSENIKKFPTSLKPFPAPPLPNPSFVTYYPRWRALVENSQGADTHALLDKGNNAALMEFLTKISNSLTEIPGSDSCEDRAFCEMAVMGSNSRAAPEQQLLWKIATQ